MTAKLLDLIGLIITLAGIIILVLGFIISRRQAIQVSVSRMSEDTDDKNLKLPHTHDRLRESRCACWGLSLLIVGFLLQVVGNWLTF